LKELNIELIAADSPESFLEDTPTATFVRQVLGAAAQLEKALLVAKLRGARQRIKAKRGKCEGRRSISELKPVATARARELRASGTSYRAISAKLAGEGIFADTGKPFHPHSIQSMCRAA